MKKWRFYKDTIPRKYLVKLGEEGSDFPAPFVNFPVLSAVIDSFDFHGNDDSINVHLRLGDILDKNCAVEGGKTIAISIMPRTPVFF